MANILFNPLKLLRNRFQSLLKPQGKLVVSGLLKNQAELLIEHYTPVFEHVLTEAQEDWVLLEFVVV